MENKDSKIRMISSGAKRLLLFLWPFAKKEKEIFKFGQRLILAGKKTND